MPERNGLRIMLTGATGALGPQLAAELLASGGVARVDVLVRSTPAASAAERFAHWVARVASIRASGESAVDTARLFLVEGDVGEAGLGLAPDDRRSLSRETDVVLHAAADTRFRGPAETQWGVNVEGTRHALEFAAGCPRLAKFVLVSTVCVAGAATGRVTETSADEPPAFINYYEQTKWTAERLALNSGLPVQSARVSIVMGSHATGEVHRMGALHHVLRWYGRGLIPRVPGTAQTTVDLISTETAARFLAKAATDPRTEQAIWHVAAGDRATPLGDLMELTAEHFGTGRRAPRLPVRAAVPGSPADPPPGIVDASAFDRIRRAVAGKGDRVMAQLMESIDSFLPGLLYPRVFDTTRAEAFWGGPLPLEPWQQTLGRVIAFIRAQGRERVEVEHAGVA
ncbi:MAG TPA: SDR family oxidoreductase [Tepidisphaeraceae bacterium]|nr:SDR family oxidoreductase [Tepidisphaeraceae bacterium]